MQVNNDYSRGPLAELSFFTIFVRQENILLIY